MSWAETPENPVYTDKAYSKKEAEMQRQMTRISQGQTVGGWWGRDFPEPHCFQAPRVLALCTINWQWSTTKPCLVPKSQIMLLPFTFQYLFGGDRRSLFFFFSLLVLIFFSTAKEVSITAYRNKKKLQVSSSIVFTHWVHIPHVVKIQAFTKKQHLSTPRMGHQNLCPVSQCIDTL